MSHAAGEPHGAGVDAPTIEYTTVSDIPTVWADVGGQFSATLRFRVGTADETLPTTGITHLVEHLALGAVDRRTVDCNGFVGLTTTTFVARGERADVERFVTDLCAALTALPAERVEAEKRVLRIEAFEPRGTVENDLLHLRYGAHSYGLGVYRQFALETATAADAQRHADRFFTASNAVLSLSAAPSPGWSLSLPRGDWQPLPDAAAVVASPAFARHDYDAIAVTWLSDVSPAADAVAQLLEQRVTDVVRHEHGLAYAVAVHAERVGTRMHWSMAAPVLPEHAAETTDAFLDVLHRLAEQPVIADELDGLLHVRRRRLAAMAPDAAAVWLDRVASQVVLGDELLHPADDVAAALAVTLDDVHIATSALCDSMLVAAPTEAPSVGFAPIVAAEVAPVTGAKFRRIDGWLNPNSKPQIVVGDEGMTLHPRNGASHTIRWDSVAAVVHDAADQRLVIGRDGTTITVEERGWARPATLTRMIDAHVDPSLVVRVDDTPPQPSGLGEQLAQLHVSLLIGGFVSFTLMALLFVAVFIAAPNAVLVPFIGGLGYLAWRCVPELRYRRRRARLR